MARDPYQELGVSRTATTDEIRKAKIILWKGFCSVHQMFHENQIAKFRAEVPGGKVISHPENSFEVCENSDFVGSTEAILRIVRASEPGTHWLVGTELNLVNRLRDETPDFKEGVASFTEKRPANFTDK